MNKANEIKKKKKNYEKQSKTAPMVANTILFHAKGTA